MKNTNTAIGVTILNVRSVSYQTSDLAMSAIEQGQAAIREKTVRLRKERLKAAQAEVDKLTAPPTPEEIARVRLRLKAKREAQKK